MIEFMVPFLMGSGFTVLIIAGTYVMSNRQQDPDKSYYTDLFATKEEFDMLCRVVHDMNRAKPAQKRAPRKSHGA